MDWNEWLSVLTVQERVCGDGQVLFGDCFASSQGALCIDLISRSIVPWILSRHCDRIDPMKSLADQESCLFMRGLHLAGEHEVDQPDSSLHGSHDARG